MSESQNATNSQLLVFKVFSITYVNIIWFTTSTSQLYKVKIQEVSFSVKIELTNPCYTYVVGDGYIHEVVFNMMKNI